MSDTADWRRYLSRVWPESVPLPDRYNHNTVKAASNMLSTSRCSTPLADCEKSWQPPSWTSSPKPERAPGEEVTRGQKTKILIATSLLSFWIIGLTQSFGIWQRHYGSDAAVEAGIVQADDIMDRPGIAAIGSLGNGGIVALLGIFYYPHLPEIGQHVKTLCAIGTAIMVLGFATACASKSLWHLLLTQGLLVGTGGGLILYTLPPILPEYFGRHSGLAQGITLAAAALGGTVLSFTTPELLDVMGTRGTLGFFAGATAIICSVVSSLALPPRKLRKRSVKVMTWRAFQRPTVSLLFVVNLLHPLTLAIPATFGPDFGKTLGYNFKTSSYWLALTSGVGTISRLCLGGLADTIGHHNMAILGTLVYALTTWTLWLAAAHTSSRGCWIAYNVFYGVVNGVFNTVMNSVQKQLFGDELYYPYNGAMTTIRGVGYLAGVPIAGSLVRRVKDSALVGRDFTPAVVYTGTLLTVSLACLLGVRILDWRNNGRQWIR